MIADSVGQFETVDRSRVGILQRYLYFSITRTYFDRDMPHLIHRNNFADDSIHLMKVFIHDGNIGTLGHFQIDAYFISVGLRRQLYR